VPAGGSWWEQAAGRLAGMVSVRRTGEKAAAKDDVSGLVARAELRLAAGDLAGAAAALRGLDGAPAEAAKPWLAAAGARLGIDDAVDTLMREALARAARGAAGG
jgi:uroporphyrinogen-III synthase